MTSRAVVIARLPRAAKEVPRGRGHRRPGWIPTSAGDRPSRPAAAAAPGGRPRGAATPERTGGRTGRGSPSSGPLTRALTDRIWCTSKKDTPAVRRRSGGEVRPKVGAVAEDRAVLHQALTQEQSSCPAITSPPVYN